MPFACQAELLGRSGSTADNSWHLQMQTKSRLAAAGDNNPSPITHPPSQRCPTQDHLHVRTCVNQFNFPYEKRKIDFKRRNSASLMDYGEREKARILQGHLGLKLTQNNTSQPYLSTYFLRNRPRLSQRTFCTIKTGSNKATI